MNRLLVYFLVHVIALAGAASSMAYAQTGDPVTAPPAALGGGDSIPEDSLRKIELEKLEANSDFKSEVSYKATSLMRLDVENKILYLSDGAQIKYESILLDADSVVVDWSSNTLTAAGKMDTSGQYRGRPVFEENGQKYNAEGMSYNFKTQRGLVQGAKTKQGDEFILASRVKKVDENTYYISNGKFTSCDQDHPHFYLKANRLKVIPRNKIITGPVQLVIEDFPIPVFLPFGFFPNKSGKKAGIIMPTYGSAEDRGFFLRNGGYYTPLSEHFDLTIRGDIFSKGGWRLEGGTTYNKRYHYNGSFGVEYGFQKFGIKGDPTYNERRNFWVRWDHNQTISPQSALTASVNAGSSNFFSNNSYDEREYLTNTLKSTINFNQSIPNRPWRFNLALDHSQNTLTKQVDLGLPSITATRTRFFPFKGKNAIGDKWYYKIGANYTMNLQNRISAPDSIIAGLLLDPTQDVTLVEIREVSESNPTADTLVTTQRGLDYFRNGIRHSLPIALQFNALKYINITPTLNFSEYWNIKERDRYWDADTMKVLFRDNYGFYTARDFNFNLNTSTRIYGVFNLGGKRARALRHTVLPSLGYTYKPDFSEDLWGVFEEVQIDTFGRTQRFSRFDGSTFSGPTAGEQQQLQFSLGNVLEMKVRARQAESDTSSKAAWTRITLLDAFGFSTNYNFAAADSFYLAPISFNARTNVLNNLLAINWNAVADPYALGSDRRRIPTYLVQQSGKLARITSMNLAFSARLQSKRGNAATANKGPVRQPQNTFREFQYYRNMYVDFDIPWSLNLSYNLVYSNPGFQRDTTTMTLNFNGDLSLTRKWKVGFTSGYDFGAKDFSYTSVSIIRDLHCWEMSMSWIPFGDRKSYQMTIGVKGGALKDLKIPKQDNWQDKFNDN
jgi:hypothetical protein